MPTPLPPATAFRPTWLAVAVSVLTVHAGAQFGTAFPIEGADVTYVRALRTADLDGDGFDDLIVGGDGFGYYPGQAAATFGRFRQIPIDPGLVRAMEARDMDADGLTDLVIAVEAHRYREATSPGAAWVLWNDGLGGFADRTLLEVSGRGLSGLQVADIDGDGQLDAYVRGWRRGLGARTFEPFVPAGAWINNALLWDLDGDGDLDAVRMFWPHSGGNIFGNLYENIGLATYAFRNAFPGSGGLASGHEAADIDGDGDLDLYATAMMGGTHWCKNEGGLKMGPTLIVGSAYSHRWRATTARDLDGDGDVDFASVGRSNLTTPVGLSWFENLGAGNFGAGVELGLPPSSIYSEYHIEAIDFDADGDLDLVQSSDETRYLELFVNHGGGNFGPATPLSPERFVEPTFVRAGDIDADGDADVLSNVREGALVFHENGGFGRFAPGLVIDQVEEVTEVLLVDLDSDTDLDLVGLADTQLFVKRFHASGYGPRAIIETDATCVAAADMNADGTPDLVIGLDPGPEGSQQILRYGVGDGSFGPAIRLPYSSRARALGAADIDGDGDVDLAVCEVSASTGHFQLRLLEQVSAGGFVRHPAINTPYYVEALVLVDRDLDGDLDVIHGSSGGMNEFTNQGFVLTPVIERRFENGPPFALGDLDGNGIVDAVVGGTYVAGFPILYRDFGLDGMRQGPALSRPRTGGVALADIDGDGQLDLVAGGGTRDLAWYRNEGGVVEAFCGPNLPNSTALPGELSLDGSTTVAANHFTLVGSQLPPGSLAVAIASTQLEYNRIIGTNSQILCLNRARLAVLSGPGQLQQSTPAGEARIPVDLTAPMPIAGYGAVLPGDSLAFQIWYRDLAPNGYAASNYSSALRISFD